MNPTNPTQLRPNLDPGGPIRPKIVFKLGSFRLHYRVEPKFEPYLMPTRPDWTRLLTLRANLTRLNPNFGSKIGFNPKKRVGFGRTTFIQKATFFFSNLFSKNVTLIFVGSGNNVGKRYEKKLRTFFDQKSCSLNTQSGIQILNRL